MAVILFAAALSALGDMLHALLLFFAGASSLALVPPAFWNPHTSKNAPYFFNPPDMKVCLVPIGSYGSDAAPAIVKAFDDCGRQPFNAPRGKVVFQRGLYTVKSVMNTTGLSNVDVEHFGTLFWDDNIDYWLSNSLPVGYQNQSSAWLWGGENVTWNGFGRGTLDGNGQVWYDFIQSRSNYPGRPHQITFEGVKNGLIEGVRFIKSQMWTMTVIHSEDVTLQDIYVNNTGRIAGRFDPLTINTDGADTIYANNITFRRWIVDNGDDAISPKANSTNILIEDCDFYSGSGVAFGSIGQYPDRYEVIENVTVRNIRFHNTRYGAYIKTWTGVNHGYPPNGGGGGHGYIANIDMSDFHLDRVNGIFAITQCTSYNGAAGDCDTSEFNIRDISLRNWEGTCVSDVIASLQCSSASPCPGISIEGMEGIIDVVNGTRPKEYRCDSVVSPTGFACTGPPWGENHA